MTRNGVLAAVRSAVGRSASSPAAPPVAPFGWGATAGDPVATFMREARAVQAEVVAAGAPSWHAALPDDLSARTWFVGPGVDVPGDARRVSGEDAARDPAGVVGIARATAGVAETGSVVIEADGAHLPSLLTDTSVVLLDPHRIVPALQDLDPAPAQVRARVLVTGPSRTADIEKLLVLGAHGPRRLIIILTGPGAHGHHFYAPPGSAGPDEGLRRDPHPQ